MSSKTANQEVDMLHGPLAKKLIFFALPLACSSILQQLFNSTDAAVVGRFDGSDALAAVGSCVAMVGIFVNLIVGLSVGPNAALSNLLGQNRRSEVHDMLHTILTFSALLGVGLMILGFLTAKPILVISGTPDNILDDALLYMRIYLLGIPMMLVYNFGSAILRSFGDTKRPLYCLFISGIFNILIKLLLVVVFHLGVAGVGIATAASNLLSASLVLFFLHREKGIFQFRFRDLCLKKVYLGKILKIGIPAGIQGALFSVSNLFVQAGINSFGSDAIAGSSLEVNFEYFCYDIVIAFAQAATTFISQNYGAGNLKRCQKIFRQCFLFGLVFASILAVIFLIWDQFFVGIYTTSASVATFAILRMQRVCALEGLTATYEVGSASLRGLGKSTEPAILTVFGTVVFRIIWMYTVFKIWPTFSALMFVYISSWLFTGTMILILYFRYYHQLKKKNLEFLH